jgi:hypothetical protein
VPTFYCLDNVGWGTGADPGFQVRGGAHKKFGVFRVKNHDITPKNLIFFNFRGGARLDPPLGYTLSE